MCPHRRLGDRVRLTASKALGLLRRITSSPSVVTAITKPPPVTNAAFSPSRPFVVHSVWPVRVSRQKNWPRLRFVSPYRYPFDSTGGLIYIGRSAFCHAGVVCHFPAVLLTPHGRRRPVEAPVNQQIVCDDRRNAVLFVIGRERDLPQQPAIRRATADDVAVRLRDDVSRPREISNKWRRICGAITSRPTSSRHSRHRAPAPLRFQFRRRERSPDRRQRLATSRRRSQVPWLGTPS